jgi:MoaA/NifB/PqqE/SkfB family radical SAM enzyme
MTAEQWIRIIDGLARLGTLRIKWQGGEPTIRKDFREISRAARNAGVLSAVVTNGIAIAEDPSLLDELDEVVVSLDSLTPAFHDTQRGPGSHAMAMAALALASERGKCVAINMVVHRESLAELEAMLEFCEARGLWLNAQAVMFGKAYQDKAAMPIGLDHATESAMYRRLAAWKREGRRLLFSAEAYDRTARWPDYLELTRNGPFPSSCPMGTEYIHIEPNGDVHPCGIHGAEFTPLNVLRDGLEAAVRNAARHNCADCALAYLNERKMLFGLRPGAVMALLRRA